MKTQPLPFKKLLCLCAVSMGLLFLFPLHSPAQIIVLDSDGDGVLDNTEVADGTDPTDGCSLVAANITEPIDISTTDVDGDSVYDRCDTDWDNDGITNANEGRTCTLSETLVYSQDFDSYTPGRVDDGGSILPDDASDPDNWLSSAGGDVSADATAFILAGTVKGLAAGDEILWFSDSPGCCMDSLFVSDPIAIVPGEKFRLNFDAQAGSTFPFPVLACYISEDNGATWGQLPSFASPPGDGL